MAVDALIGDSGFVGTNLARQHGFAASFNSRTIGQAAGNGFDTVLCAAAPGSMFEANRFPDLVKSFYEQGPGRATSRLAEVLAAANKRGEIRTSDCTRTAGHFVGMIRDNLHLQVVLGLRAAPSDREVQAAVGSAVEVFLNGVQPRRNK